MSTKMKFFCAAGKVLNAEDCKFITKLYNENLSYIDEIEKLRAENAQLQELKKTRIYRGDDEQLIIVEGTRVTTVTPTSDKAIRITHPVLEDGTTYL